MLLRLHIFCITLCLSVCVSSFFLLAKLYKIICFVTDLTTSSHSPVPGEVCTCGVVQIELNKPKEGKEETSLHNVYKRDDFH